MSEHPINPPDTSGPDMETEEALMARLADALKPVIDRIGYEGIEELGKLMARLNQDNREIGRHLLKQSPEIITRLIAFGEESVGRVYQLGNFLISFGPMVVVKFLEKSPGILSQGGGKVLEDTAQLASQVARIHEGTAVKMLEIAPYLLSLMGFEGLEKVGTFAAVIARSSWTYALKALENSGSLIAQLLKKGDKRLVLQAYDLAIRLAYEDWNYALKIIEDSLFITSQFVDQDRKGELTDLYAKAGKLLPMEARVIYELLLRAPSLSAKVGVEGLEVFWQCLRRMTPGNTENMIVLLKRIDEIIDGLSANLDSRQIQEFLGLASELAGIGSHLAFRFLMAGGDLLRRLDFQEIKPVTEVWQTMARVSLQAAEALLEVTSALLDRVGWEGLKKISELITPIAGEYWETGTRLLLKSPDLIDRLGLEGLKVVSDFSLLLAHESGTTAVQLLDKCPLILDRLLKDGNPALIAGICRLGSRIAPFNARLAVSLLETSPDVMALTGFSGLEKLEGLAQQVGQESWSTAVTLVETSSSLIERIGFDGLEQVAAFARVLARENSYGAISLLENSPDWMDRLSRFGDRALILNIYKLAESMIPEGWRLSTALLEKSPDILARLGVGGLKSWADLMRKTARDNSPCAVHLMELSPAVLDRIGFEGLERLSELIRCLSQKSPSEALALMEKIPGIIDRLDRRDSMAVLDLVVKVAVTSPLVGARLLEKSSEFLQWVGLEGLGMIAVFVQDAAARDEEKALSMLSGQSTAFADFMEHIPKGLELKTIKPLLATYLKALLGRRVELAEAETIYTDGKKIYLPARVKEFQDPRDNFSFYKVMATHQEAHLEYGSFEFDLAGLGKGLAEVKQRYGLKDEGEENDIDRFIAHFPEADLARDLFNLLEDFRIETILKEEYPALGQEIGRINHHQLLKRRSPQKMTNPKQRLVEMMGQSPIMGKSFNDDADPVFPVYRQIQAMVDSLKNRGATVLDSARITVLGYQVLDEAFKEPYQQVKPLSKPLNQDMVTQNIGSFGKTSQKIQDRLGNRPGQGGNRPQSQPEAESGAEGSTQPSQGRPLQENIEQRPHTTGKNQPTFQGPAGGGKMESGDSDSSSEETGRSGESFKYDSKEKIERLLQALYRERGITPKEIEQRMEALYKNEIYLFLHNLEGLLGKKAELESERGTFLYSEWGEDINDYRPNWTRIREQTLPGRSLEFYKNTLEKHGGLLKKIRREFQMLKPEEFTRLKRQYDGHEIDLDAFVDYLVDRRVGLSPNEQNYSLHQKKKRDIAVAFLIDMSRSTKGATITQEKESLIIMSEALNEVGDAFAVYGFSGDNRDNVDFYRIKDFDDLYSDPVKKRISAIEDYFENRDGTAIRHTTYKLRKRSERTKLIILLSDGKPVDKDYSGPYAIEDTRLALKEAHHSGIKTFCITVDRTAAEYLPRMYSHSSWTVIDDAAKLPEKITRIYRMLTG